MSLKKYIRGCVSLKKQKSQGNAVEVTVNSKEENLKTFVWISSKTLASGKTVLNLYMTTTKLVSGFTSTWKSTCYLHTKG